MKTVWNLIAAAGLFALWACASSEHVDGQLPNPDKLAMIELGVHTRDDVAEILGSPSTSPPFNEDSWYYIRRITRTIAFFDPVLLDQQVVAVDFDEEGIVEDIRFISEKDGFEVSIVDRITPTQGRELTFWDQLLSSYGRVPSSGQTETGRP